MKKNYIQPNILVEKLDSFDVIVTSSTPGIYDPNNPNASGDGQVLSPKRRGIWDSDY